MDIDRALTDPGFFVDQDPHPLWQQLRREDPVHWTEGLIRGFWSVTRYDDIIAVFREPNLFTSTRGLVLPSSTEMEQITPEMVGAGQMMIMTDPPLHGAPALLLTKTHRSDFMVGQKGIYTLSLVNNGTAATSGVSPAIPSATTTPPGTLTAGRSSPSASGRGGKIFTCCRCRK